MYQTYHRLFMEDERFTQDMDKHLKGLLGVFQALLQDEIFISLARLTDKDSSAQENLSIWSLSAGTSRAKDPAFRVKVESALQNIYAAAQDVRKHRHKRLAHFDLKVSLNSAKLPPVSFEQIKGLITQIEALLNLFYSEFEQTTMLFDAFSSNDVSARAEMTVYKAIAYDRLEASGNIPRHEWRRSIKEA